LEEERKKVDNVRKEYEDKNKVEKESQKAKDAFLVNSKKPEIKKNRNLMNP
jgi:hypothetical protein